MILLLILLTILKPERVYIIKRFPGKSVTVLLTNY